MGRALLITISIFAIVLGLIQVGVNQQSLNSTSKNSITAKDAQALLTANSALDVVLQKLRTQPNWKNSGSAYSVSLEGGSADVLIEDWQDDGSLSQNPRHIRLTSTSVIDDESKTVIILAELKNNVLPNINSALGLYADTDNVELLAEGSNFNISGHDTNIDGSSGPAASVHGIYANSQKTQDAFLNEGQSKIQDWQENNIIGEGGTPSVTYDPTIDEPDFSQLISDLSANADRTFNNDHSQPAASWGTALNPEITVVNSTQLQITTGDLTGHGILIINGDDTQIQVSQNINWNGMIIMNGKTAQLQVANGDMNLNGLLYIAEHKGFYDDQLNKSQLQIQSGSLNLYGSAIVNMLGSTIDNPQFQWQVKQDINMNYSTEALTLANSYANPFSIGKTHYTKLRVYE